MCLNTEKKVKLGPVLDIHVSIGTKTSCGYHVTWEDLSGNSISNIQQLTKHTPKEVQI